MNRATKLSLTLAFCVMATPASALDFMGIPLGQAPTFPECKHFAYDKPAEYMKPGYGTQPVRPCWLSRPLKGESERLSTLAIHAAPEHWPATVTTLTAITVDGRIEALVAETNGQAGQEEILSGLKRKFGPPTKLSSTPARNAFGAVYQSIDAEWVTPDGRVEMSGIKGRRDSGQVMVITKAGEQTMSAIEQAAQDRQPSF